MHQAGPRGLKIAFSQLGFDEQLSQFQVDLSAIIAAVLQRDCWSEAEDRMDARLGSEQGTDDRTMRDPGVTKDVHE